MTAGVQVALLGLALGGVYALMASGLTLVFGVMRIVNLAHGVLIVAAAYIAYLAAQQTGLDPILSIALTAPALFLLGISLYPLLFPRIAGRSRYVEMTVLLTFGLALVVEGFLGFLFTGIYRSTSPVYATQAFVFGPFFLPKAQLYAFVTSLVLLSALGAFLLYTRTGHAVRATMQNRTAAQIVGVNVERVSTLSFGIGLALAGAAGSLVSFVFTFFPARHWQWIAILLALIILGGMGSIAGAIVGALVLGAAASFASSYVGPTWSPLTFFLALFLILLVKPEGLFGKPMEEA